MQVRARGASWERSLFKRRDRAWKQGLLERAQPFLPADERIRVVAVAQGGYAPAVPIWTLAIGFVLVSGGLIGETYFPRWMGIFGVLVALVGSGMMAYVPRHFLLRTDQTLYVFEVPHSKKAAFGEPSCVVDSSDLPDDPQEHPALVCGRRLWAVMGNDRERAAMAEALAAEVP